MAPPAHPGRILIVEDDPDMRDALVGILESAGYDAIAAGAGDEALARLRSTARPGLILLDLMLPGMDGFEFRLRQSEDPELAPIPVVVVSGGVDLPRKVAPLEPAAWLQKPVDPDELLRIVERVIGTNPPDPMRARRRTRGRAGTKAADRWQPRKPQAGHRARRPGH